MRIEDDPRYERYTVSEVTPGSLNAALLKVFSEEEPARDVEAIEGRATSFATEGKSLAGSGEILYQWQMSSDLEASDMATGFEDILSSDRRFTGADTDKLIIPMVTEDMDEFRFRCIVLRVGSSMRAATRWIVLHVIPSVEAEDITVVQESTAEYFRRIQEERRIERLMNYGN